MILPTDQLTEKISQWKRIAELMKKNIERGDATDELIKDARLITECGEILNVYAGLMQFASDRYEENEYKLIRALED